MRFFLTAIIALCTLNLSAQKELTLSTPLIAPFTADGLQTDWKQPFSYYDGSSKLEYAVSNDAENLYVCVRTIDAGAQRKALQRGISLSIGSGKKSTAVMSYPHPEAADLRLLQTEAAQSAGGRQELVRMMLSQMNRMRISGFVNLGNTETDRISSTGLQAAASLDEQGMLLVEYRIPFSLLPQTPSPDKPLPVTITLNGFQQGANRQTGSSEDGWIQDPGMNGGGGMNGMNGMGGNAGFQNGMQGPGMMQGGMPGSLQQGMSNAFAGNPGAGFGSNGQGGPPPGYGAVQNPDGENNIRLRVQLFK